MTDDAKLAGHVPQPKTLWQRIDDFVIRHVLYVAMGMFALAAVLCAFIVGYLLLHNWYVFFAVLAFPIVYMYLVAGFVKLVNG